MYSIIYNYSDILTLFISNYFMDTTIHYIYVSCTSFLESGDFSLISPFTIFCDEYGEERRRWWLFVDFITNNWAMDSGSNIRDPFDDKFLYTFFFRYSRKYKRFYISRIKYPNPQKPRRRGRGRRYIYYSFLLLLLLIIVITLLSSMTYILYTLYTNFVWSYIFSQLVFI